MSKNAGQKIKDCAITLRVLRICLSVLMAVGLFFLAATAGKEGGGYAACGVFALIFGAFGAWINSVVLYGFGQLVENSDRIAACILAKKKSDKINVEKILVQARETGQISELECAELKHYIDMQ